LDFSSIFGDIIEKNQDNNLTDGLQISENLIKEQQENTKKIEEIFQINLDQKRNSTSPILDSCLIKQTNTIDDKYKANVFLNHNKNDIELNIKERKDEIFINKKQAEKIEITKSINDKNNSLILNYLQSLNNIGLTYTVFNGLNYRNATKSNKIIYINKINLISSFIMLLLISIQLICSYLIFQNLSLNSNKYVYYFALGFVVIYVIFSFITYLLRPNLQIQKIKLKEVLRTKVLATISFLLIIFAVNIFSGVRFNSINSNLIYMIIPSILSINLLIEYLVKILVIKSQKN